MMGNAQRRFILQMFFVHPAVVLSSGLLFALCPFSGSFFYRSFSFTELKNKKTKTAKIKMSVYACVIILCSFLCHFLQNNKE